MDEPIVEQAVEPEDAFSILADEHRIEILQALWEHDAEVVPFSELRVAVGMDDSGQFNYHLGKLTDRFVGKTDEGYELQPAGKQVVGTLLAGAYTETGRMGPVSVGEPCQVCGGDRTFTYEGEYVRIECTDCDVGSGFTAPPGVFASYDPDEFPWVADRYVRTMLSSPSNGFCHFCGGSVRSSLHPFRELDRTVVADLDDLPMARYECDRCGETLSLDLAAALFDEPALIAFFHDHGVDPRAVPFWRLAAVSTERSRITSREPLRARVSYTHSRIPDEQLVLTVDESCSVVDDERTTSSE